MIIKKEDWILFQILTGDTNPLHFDRDYAIKKGVKDIIAPGMYVFFKLIGNEPSFSKCDGLELKFVGEVLDGDDINIEQVSEGEAHLKKKTACEYKPVVKIYKKPVKEPECLGEILSYEKIMTQYYIDKISELTGIHDKDVLYRLGVGGFIPPALLRCADKEGMYRSQELNFHRNANIRDRIGVYIEKKPSKEDSPLERYSTICKNQNGEIIISGEARCVDMDKLRARSQK